MMREIRFMRPRGVAILMVIAVLAALLAIVTPFVFSMLQHGKSARNDASQQIAREGSEASIQHAIADRQRKDRAFFGTHNASELNVDLPPEVTTPKDLLVDMGITISDDMISKYKLDTNFQNPRGMMWSAKMEDEQGKINVNSAPPALIGNLLASALLTESVQKGETTLAVDDASEFNPTGGIICMNGERAPLHYSSASRGSIQLDQAVEFSHGVGTLVFDGRGRLISNGTMPSGPAFAPYRSNFEIKTAPGLTAENALPPEDFARIERHITVENGMGNPTWGHGERIGDASMSGDMGGVGLKNGQGYSPGTLVRIVTNGNATGFGRVLSIKMKEDGSATVEFEQPIGGGGDETTVGGTYVEPQMKHPVNINTASDEVLVAVFTGVCARGSKTAVPKSIAIALVDYLRGRTPGLGTGGRRVFTTAEDIRKAIYRAFDAGIITLPMRDALAINATEPNSSRLSLCTVPFICHSHGSYTIEGSGVANADTGMQLARHTVRELVTVPTPLPGRYRINWQAGFQTLIDQGMSSRVATFPEVLGTHRFRKGAPLDRFPRMDTGNVRLTVGESGSLRGRSSMIYEWLNHCDDETDGRFKQEGFDITKGSGFTLPPSTQPGTTGLGNKNVATPATSCELWYRPKGGGQCTFYDEGLQDDRNRVNFSYDPSEGGLVIRIWDSTLPSDKFKHVVEFVYPITLNSGDWYHVAGSWKTSHPGGQEIRVDAQPFPQNNPKLLQFKPGGRLGEDLGLTSDPSDTISLSDGDGKDFPKAGALKIGEEIIEYTSNSGGSFSGLFRGARLSAAFKHKAGEWVMPYGYVNVTDEDLYVGNGKLTDDLPTENRTHTVIQLPFNANPNFILDTEVKKITVADASDFPATGFICCQGEGIYYGSKKKGANGTWELNKLQRAQTISGQTGPARNLDNGKRVDLCSIAVTNNADYRDRDGIIQLDDENNSKKVEWIEYYDKRDVDGKHYFIGKFDNGVPRFINTGNPAVPSKRPVTSIGKPAFRHKFGIGDSKQLGTANGVTSSHTKGTKVIPVIRMNGPHCGGWYEELAHDSPYGEDGVSEVSIVEKGKQDGDLRWVKQGYQEQLANTLGESPNRTFDRWTFNFYVGLNDFVSRRYPARETRFLRWPTGELPDAVNASRHICEDKNGDGKVNGDVDEIRVNSFSSIGGRIAMNTEAKGIDAGDDTIYVENYDSWPVNHPLKPGRMPNPTPVENIPLKWPINGCLARIEDELVYFTDVQAERNKLYYADKWPPLMNNPPEKNKEQRIWINDNGVHELHPNLCFKDMYRLTNVKRGILNTKAVEHPVGTQIMVLDAMAVTHLKANYGASQDSFTVADAAGFPNEGYAWINDEVVSYKKKNGNTFTGTQYFRGRFGTSASDHEKDDIVRCLPFRYWDRNASGYDGDGLAFIQSGYRAASGKWFGFELNLMGTEELPQVPNAVSPHVLVRFDGKPGWDADVTNREGGLFEFTGKRVMRFSGTQGIKADQMEVRVMWKYMPSAFNKGNSMDWKRTFSIEKMRARYESPLIMRRLDEVEKR